MAFPNYPNVARRARILEAQQLRQRGLTMRQIGRRMDCSVSTVHGYLRDFELFRTDLMREYASDLIVSHLVHLDDIDDPHRAQRINEMRELRLLLSSVANIRRDDDERIRQLNHGGVKVDNYGNRYPVPDRLYEPTTEEQQRCHQRPDHDKVAGRPHPDVPLAYIPEPTRTEPNTDEHNSCPPLDEEVATLAAPTAPQDEITNLPAPVALREEIPNVPYPPAERGEMPQPAPGSDPGAEGGSPLSGEHSRTKPNTAEQDSAPNPDQDGTSPDHDPIPLPPSIQQDLDHIEQQLSKVLRFRDWLNDYPPHNPGHPMRREALNLVKRKEALLARAAHR